MQCISSLTITLLEESNSKDTFVLGCNIGHILQLSRREMGKIIRAFRVDYQSTRLSKSTIFEFQARDVSRALALHFGFR